MEALIDLSWRGYPAAFLIVLGLSVGLRGGWRFAAGFGTSCAGASGLRAGLRGFRRGIVGLALAALGAAWLWQIDWLAALALVIAGEEVWESTLHIQAVGMSERQAQQAARLSLRRPSRERPRSAPPAAGAALGSALLVPAGRRRPASRF